VLDRPTGEVRSVDRPNYKSGAEGAMMGWCGWLLLGAFAFLCGYEWCAGRIAPPHWHLSRRKRRAMWLALQAAARAGQAVQWRRSRVVRSDRAKCFVLVQNASPVGFTPEGYRMYAVWSATEQVDDLGDWVFHWGVSPAAAIATSEQCRAEGRPWPNGFAEWVRYWE
jgi:hypothetical protein